MTTCQPPADGPSWTLTFEWANRAHPTTATQLDASNNLTYRMGHYLAFEDGHLAISIIGPTPLC